MEKEIIISGASMLVAVFAAYMSSTSNAKLLKITNKIKQEEKKAHYREPFVQSIYYLQQRLFQIIKMNFLNKMIINSESTRTQEYAKNNTVYLMAQFFAWNELIRHELFNLDVNDKKLNKKLVDSIDLLYSEWRYEDFQLYSGEQRAIGEVMIENNKCIGYSSFLKKYSTGNEDIINVLYEFLNSISNNLKSTEQLIALHSKLIDILDIIDNDKSRFPLYRDKIVPQ